MLFPAPESPVTTTMKRGAGSRNRERELRVQASGELGHDVAAALPEKVYVSFDIDGLDPALCPSTGTPVPGGLTFQQAAYLLKRVVLAGTTIIGFDLNEVAPGPDGDEWDANVGARP